MVICVMAATLARCHERLRAAAMEFAMICTRWYLMKTTTKSAFASAPGLLAVGIMAISQVTAAEPSEHAASVAQSFDRITEADEKFNFLSENCMECHNAEDWAGSLA